MAALTKAALTVPEKAALIRRHFPALMPIYDGTRGVWTAPSMTDKGVSYDVFALRHGDQPVHRQCSCKATRVCTHEWLIEEITDGALMPGERINGRLDTESRHELGRLPSPPSFDENRPLVLPRVTSMDWATTNLYRAEDDRAGRAL